VNLLHVVCGLIVKDDGAVLACQRGADGHLAGLWEFPGGKVEEGETAREAIVRELREELAIEVCVVSALRAVDWDYGRGAIRLIPFVCQIVAGEPQALEHQALRWCDGTNWQELDWAGADLPVWEEYLRVRDEA
jgi:8-oxo-dGTP diphosphatase